jgi:hypothetical protein
MCRSYGARVRVCRARGGPKMIAENAAQWNAAHTHVLGQSGRRCLRVLGDGERCPRCKRAMIVCRDRCIPGEFQPPATPA